MEIEPVAGEAAAIAVSATGRRFLVVCDLHLGLTDRLGLFRPRPDEEAEEMKERLLDTAFRMQTNEVLILGDVKHGLYGPSNHERTAIRLLTRSLAKEMRVWVVKGNHDFRIEEDVDPHVTLISSGGLTIDDCLLFHGHALPSRRTVLVCYETVVSGHIHPQVYGRGEWERVWLILNAQSADLKPKEVVVLPHFNDYASRVGYMPGPPIMITPYLRRLNLSNYEARILNLDGKTMERGLARDMVSHMNDSSGAGRI